MRLTIHRGTKEIGGSCIELTTSATRIVLDIGMPLVDAAREPFDQSSIRGKSVAQLLGEGILPNVSGLFDDRPAPDAILLSHAHIDHTGLMSYSRPEIPIYASKGTSKVMLAGALFSRQVQLPTERYREMKAGHPFTIGDFRITPYSVDHSAFDSLALLVEADGKSLLYSGDLRMHGRKPGMGKKLISEVLAKRIDLLLMEGTHFGGGSEIGISEYDLEEEIVAHLKDAQGIVLACFSPADVDRLVTYYRVAQRTERTFVADVYAAFVLHLVSGQSAIPRPVKSAGIRVFYNCSFEESYERRHRQRIHDLFIEDRITLEEILAEPQRHLMVFRPSMAKLDLQDRLPSGCRCLYSYWKGYLKNPDWVQFQELVKAAQGDFIPAHASGHIYTKDLIEFVRAINARTVVPIHTFEPQEFRKHFDNVTLLDDRIPLSVT
jgi:ribonuclease J